MCLLASAVWSQTLPNTLRQKSIAIVGDTIAIDSLSIVPGTLEIYTDSGVRLSEEHMIIDYSKAEIIFNKNNREISNQTLHIKYRIIPIDLSHTYRHKDTLLIIGNFSFKKQNIESNSVEEQGFTDDDKLDKNGSISRGLAFGNQRDLISLSNLNLQLSGKLNDEVSILAAISDNNLPIQPEGNTQQIQEFDKIFIQMFTAKSGIKLGDIELNKPSGYFMELKKQTRGLQMYSAFNLGKLNKFSLKSELSAGLAKGKYAKLKIQGIEGNQGPYRLFGANNETYIIILSGSEKVFIDGKLLTRGEKFDYVIDYNSAEIVFTSNLPISKDSRITVEFEYAQQIYPRLQAFQTNYLQGKNATFWFNFYTEKDNKNDPLSENYNDETKTFLASIGDSINLAIAPNIRQVEFESDKILYELKDTIVGGQLYDSVYQYSTNPTLTNYQLGFSYVGENKGNYKTKLNNANGKVYEWSAPVNGIKQGTYEPIAIFITPKKSSMGNIGGVFKTGQSNISGFEFAFSNLDVNTYSSKDNGDDKGFAFRFNMEQGILNRDTNNVQLKIFANYQMADKKFKPIENFYEVEFERDWNLPVQISSWQEQRLTGGFLFLKKDLGFVTFSGNYMLRTNQYAGKKALFDSKLKFKGFQIESHASYLNTNDISNESKFIRHKVILSKHMDFLTIGVSEESEQNSRYLIQTDSLLQSSFKFSEYAVFISEPDSSVNQYFASYKYRHDYLPLSNTLQSQSRAHTMQAGVNLIKNKVIKIKNLITYRNLEYIDSSDLVRKTEEILSGRQEINVQLAKSAINYSFFYETGSGIEIKKEYIYVEVQKGQGQFTWIDYNLNNIKELDEFELAKFVDQADHIRLFIPGKEYVRAYTTQMNHSLLIQPDRIWAKKTGIRSFLSLFSDQFAFRIMQKSDRPNFIPDLKDNLYLISQIWMVRNNFSVKSKNRKGQVDYLFENSINKSLLVNGTDNRSVLNHSVRLRWKMIDLITLFNTSLLAEQSFNSEYFSWKNYLIKNKSNEVGVQLQPSESFYSILNYRFSLKNNHIGFESSRLDEIKLNVNQVLSTKINILADLSFVQVNYNAEASTSVAYEMLEGLKVGKNLIWSISYNHKLSKVFYLSLGYNGRSSELNPTIHNGSVQLKANF